jgi:hypothetical protein
MCTERYFEKRFQKKYGGFGRNVRVKGIRLTTVTAGHYN